MKSLGQLYVCVSNDEYRRVTSAQHEPIALALHCQALSTFSLSESFEAPGWSLPASAWQIDAA